MTKVSRKIGATRILFRIQNAVTIAKRIHLFPYRTQKLSSSALMILGGRPPGKAGRCRLFWSYGQAVKTPPFHGGNPGSIPGRITMNKARNIFVPGFLFAEKSTKAGAITYIIFITHTHEAALINSMIIRAAFFIRHAA